MTTPSDETDMFRIELACKDDNKAKFSLLDKAVIKAEGKPKDPDPNEERTREEGVFRKSYVNKRCKLGINEVTFRVEKSPSCFIYRKISGTSLQLAACAKNSVAKTKDVGISIGTEQAALPFGDPLQLSPCANEEVVGTEIGSVEIGTEQSALPVQTEGIRLVVSAPVETEVKQVYSSLQRKVKRVPLPMQTKVKNVAVLPQLLPIQKLEEKNISTKPSLVKTAMSSVQTVVGKVTSHITQAEVTKVQTEFQNIGAPTPIEKVMEKLMMKRQLKSAAPHIETEGEQVALPVSVASKQLEPILKEPIKGDMSSQRKAEKLVSTPNEKSCDVVQPHVIALLKNRASDTLPQNLPKRPVTLPSGKVIYLTPVAKEVVMRKNAVVHVLPDTVVMEPEAKSPTKSAAKDVVMRNQAVSHVLSNVLPKSPSKLPIYLRKDAELAKPSKPVSQLPQEISYTGIYSSNSEPISSPKKTESFATEYLTFAPTSLNRPILRKEFPAAFLKPKQKVGETSYGCTTCKKIFTKKKHLNVHLKIHTGERKAACKPCLDCGKLFIDNTQLQIHSRVHSGAKPFACKLCTKKFKHKTSLSRHSLYHTQERPCACDVCPKTYRNNSDLANHKRSHTNERPFSCKFCDKRFNDRCAKNTHERIHLDKKYKCNVCLQSFAQSTTLKGHMVTHSEDRPFSCTRCEMKFKSKVVLRSHERVHTAGKTFQCEFCKLLFTEKRTLTRHVYTHKEKPFPCSFCKRWYFRQDRYLAHLEKHNTKERPFKCEFCHKRYTNEGYLKLHSLKAHLPTEENVCKFQCKFKFCEEKFGRLISLTRHMKTHGNIFVLECDICKKRFAKKRTLQLHLITVHKFACVFTCSKCDKVFIKKSHLKRHILLKCS